MRVMLPASSEVNIKENVVCNVIDACKSPPPILQILGSTVVLFS